MCYGSFENQSLEQLRQTLPAFERVVEQGDTYHQPNVDRIKELIVIREAEEREVRLQLTPPDRPDKEPVPVVRRALVAA